MTDKLKPFDLERALAGDPVVTRDWTPVNEIRYFKEVKNKHKILAILIEDGVLRATTHYIDGKYDDGSSVHDLFMVPKTTTYYCNVYRRNTKEINNKDIYLGSPLYTSYVDAQENLALYAIHLKTISFEVEE